MKPLNWFGIILVYTALTLLSVYLIPVDSAFVAVRAFLGFTFVVFVPGYCLVSLLFQEGKLDFAEKLVLSVALSFSLAGISGLFLGLSPIGINFASITQTLSGIVMVLAALVFLSKMGWVKRPWRKHPVQTPQVTS
ncbi:MAG: DUF1616 domain-containing protein [Candidatus Bathyarchaeota archaeon]|nr:DUF1616 domain-containing protein [Candidatus Bathyarchaeota archaeon]